MDVLDGGITRSSFYGAEVNNNNLFLLQVVVNDKWQYVRYHSYGRLNNASGILGTMRDYQRLCWIGYIMEANGEDGGTQRLSFMFGLALGL